MPQVNNPELHETALQFIALVQEQHVAGSGNFPLMDLVRMFGLQLNHDQSSAILSRGDLSLASKDNTCGVFQNRGRIAQFRAGLASMRTPKFISGYYYSDADHCIFRFDPMHTIFGVAFVIMCSNLKSIYVDRDVIKIELDDMELNYVIRHGAHRKCKS